jgi:hypothetical protein
MTRLADSCSGVVRKLVVKHFNLFDQLEGEQHVVDFEQPEGFVVVGNDADDFVFAAAERDGLFAADEHFEHSNRSPLYHTDTSKIKFVMPEVNFFLPKVNQPSHPMQDNAKKDRLAANAKRSLPAGAG